MRLSSSRCVKTAPSEWSYGGRSRPTCRPTSLKRARPSGGGGGRPPPGRGGARAGRPGAGGGRAGLVGEWRGGGGPAVLGVRADVALAVGVDDEEVQSAVVVVVDPAEPAAHHGRVV